MGGRQLRGGGGGGEPAVVRLEAALRKAEAAVLTREKMEVGLLVKEFFDGPVEAVLQRMAGSGGRRPAVAEARGAAARARAAGAAGSDLFGSLSKYWVKGRLVKERESDGGA